MIPYAAIDFGTSNSAVCIGQGSQCRLVTLEDGKPTMPTAVFFNAEENHIAYGRQAIAEYQAAYGGRLLRSLKSLLGSDLLGETTLINNKAIAYREIIGHFLSQLKQTAEAQAGSTLEKVVLGRPVHFVDDNAERDRLAESSLAQIARDNGFTDVHFQYEPIAAALDYESQLTREALVLVADIGGGTSDFSLIRLGPERASRLDRSADVLANAGIHIAGTDFDQQLSLGTVMPCLGFGSKGKEGKPVPSHIYFELATWHRINFLYAPRALSEAETLRDFYKAPTFHQRLMKVLREREGHRIAGLVEEAKVAVADSGKHLIQLGFIEKGLMTGVDDGLLGEAIAASVQKVVATALDAVRDAGITPQQVDAVYFTGGSTGIRALREPIAAAFAGSEQVMGDRFASVARGLGVYAGKLFA